MLARREEHGARSGEPDLMLSFEPSSVSFVNRNSEENEIVSQYKQPTGAMMGRTPDFLLLFLTSTTGRRVFRFHALHNVLAEDIRNFVPKLYASGVSPRIRLQTSSLGL